MISFTFLVMVFSLVRRWFFTNCCVMVDAHCICVSCPSAIFMLCMVALMIEIRSTHLFSQNDLSSVATIALIMWSLMFLYSACLLFSS